MTSNAIAGISSVHASLVRSQGLVEPLLREVVSELPDPLSLAAGYHFGWWDAQGGPTAPGGGGKGIRSTLVLTAARGVRGTPGDALNAAAAVELVHNYTLVHDDVMDDDVMRRHRPTVWRTFGVDQAILLGDALQGQAFDLMTRSARQETVAGLRVLSMTLLELAAGQSDDLRFRRVTTVSLAECLRMADQKTAALLGCSCAGRPVRRRHPGAGRPPAWLR